MYTLVETFTDDNKRFIGRTFGDIALELGKTPWDTMCDIVVADDLRTSFSNPDRGQDDESWKRRVEVWRDPRALVGASDAGAHLDMIDSFAMHTQMLGKAVRERQLLGWDEAIHLITQAPAELYGIRDRGVLREGAYADITVIDPTTIGQDVLHTRFDLPTGAARLFAEAIGVEHVFVNGTEVVHGKQFTEARPGTLLRSGRDTDTVTAR
jgi:N-acyl-D-aspartate/D-glutamate deacylase